MIHATRLATAALSHLIKLALASGDFNPQKVDQKYIFSALDVQRSNHPRPAN
jgi:hypothetical protein